MAKKTKEFEYEYNPIKEQIGGEKAEAIIWTTKSIERALEGMKKGLPLKTNPFIGKQTNLLRPELVYRRTEEEIQEYINCMDDPIHFAQYCKLMTPKGLKHVTLRDYQEDYLRHLQQNNFSIFLSCRQSGKCESLCSQILIQVKNFKNIKNKKLVNKLEKKDYFYIKDNIYKIPLFELYDCFCKQSFKWKIKYQLYKLIFKLQSCQEKKDKKE